MEREGATDRKVSRKPIGYISVCSEISRASSTSTPKYRTESLEYSQVASGDSLVEIQNPLSRISSPASQRKKSPSRLLRSPSMWAISGVICPLPVSPCAFSVTR